LNPQVNAIGPDAAELGSAAPVRTFQDVDSARFKQEVESVYAPAILRQFVREWPAVAAARNAPKSVADYLAERYNGTRVHAFLGNDGTAGRYFYEADAQAFNFRPAETSLSALLAALLDPAEAHHSMYMGSTPTSRMLPAFSRENPLKIAADRGAEPRIWIGNGSRIAAHYDESDNIACVVSGRRRFILFPPEQVANLYVGPIDHTVAGQPISMVDLDNPDFDRFPRFREALKHALVADLEPGDAIYIPALWWHAVQATGELNVLVNYWWTGTAADAGSPMHALGHGLLTISHLPEHKRRAWRILFDHYVFRLNGDPAAHIPVSARGIIGRSTPELRRMIKQFLMRALSSL
jgi:hypothetical protein